MKTPIKLSIAIVISLCVISPPIFADETDKPSTALILEIDLSTLNTPLQQAPKMHTYNQTAKKKRTDAVSTSLVRAKKVLKRITSLRYRKNQKLRALIGKSSYTVQYTHTL